MTDLVGMLELHVMLFLENVLVARLTLAQNVIYVFQDITKLEICAVVRRKSQHNITSILKDSQSFSLCLQH